ncbi:MAG: diguanylate cyclase [Rhodocyclaceae bacterium]|nr:diguanylate cyclase [Rhodocyclaceae bacterium]
MTPIADHITDAIAAGLVVIDAHGIVRVWNRWMEEHSAVAAPAAIGRALSDIFEPGLERRVLMAIREAVDFGLASLLSHALHPSPFPLHAYRNAGDRLKQSVTISPIAGEGAARWCLIQINDVTSLVKREQLLRQQTRQLTEKLKTLTQAQEQLRRNEMRFRELARQAPVGIFETDLFGRIVFANERWQHMVGHLWDHHRVDAWYDVVAIEDRESVVQNWKRASESGARYQTEFRCTNRNSMRKFWVSVDAMPVRNDDGQTVGYIATAIDIHDAKETSLRNAQQATFDALTGLYNRTPFNERLGKAIESAAGRHQFALMFIDLDRFKAVNDAHGHEAGDLVLKAIARRLRRLLRVDDTVARFGGDEFVVLLADFRDERDLARVAAKIDRAIAQPINIGTCHVELGCSVGCSIYPRDGADAASLMRRADGNMYEAKHVRREPGDDIAARNLDPSSA